MDGMGIEMRTCTSDDVAEMFEFDGRNFGSMFSEQEVAEVSPTMEWDRMQVAVDGGRIASAVGAFTIELSVPGGQSIPTCGITWVSTSPTHRRRGLMSRLIARAHDQAAERNEAMSALGASESAIYGRFGYGLSTFQRKVIIDTRAVRLTDRAPVEGDVWFENDRAAILAHAAPIREQGRAQRCGEVLRSQAWWNLVLDVRQRENDGQTPAFWLLHRDGYASYRITAEWNGGRPAHKLAVVEMVCLTDAAAAALWNVLLSVDLVGTISTSSLPFDDPLPLWLDNPRGVRVEDVTDWFWIRPIDTPRMLASRTYGSEQRFVIQVDDGAPFVLDGSPDGATTAASNEVPDLVLQPRAVGPLLMGAVSPRTLRAGGSLSASDDVVRRAVPFFAADPLPYSQMMF
jgi:predicted acetyltransferase